MRSNLNVGSLLILGCLCLVAGQGNPGLILGSEAGVNLLVEPGILTSGQDWLVPLILLDDAGDSIELPVDDIHVTSNGEALKAITVGYFAPEPGGYPSSSAVLLDQGAKRMDLAPVLAFLNSGSTDGRRALFRCGRELTVLQQWGQIGLSDLELQKALPGEEPARLWDCILEAITALDREGQVRKVLLVISGGNEELVSEYPLATCIDAAVRARVSVHVVELEGSSDGLSRLRKLASQTGGKSAALMDEGSLFQALFRIDEFRALRGTLPQGSLPMELAISFGFSTEVTGTALIADQKELSGSGVWLVTGLGFGLLAVVGGGVILLKVSRRNAGVLLVDFQGRQKEVMIPHSGMTMGSERDNQLVFADQRISRHHAVIRVKNGKVILTDLRSRSGTLVNGSSVRNASLRHGDKILLGQVAELTLGLE